MDELTGMNKGELIVKKYICMLLVCALLGACALAEGLLPELEEVYGVPMPSLYTLLKRYPDAIDETDAGLEETWENLTDEDFSGFGEHLSASGCDMLNYTSENGVFDAEVGKSGKTCRFIYDAAAKRATLVFPAGTYDEALYDAEQNYKNACELIKAGEYEQALALLCALRGYRDVSDILDNDEKIAKLMWRTPGCSVMFGRYEQDGDTANGKEDIEWIVLDSDGETTKLISRFALDSQPYHTQKEDVTWETSSLRKWLNDNFLNEAFSEDEQARLTTVTVTADANPVYSTNPGNDTQDRVFLLSIGEAGQYFISDADRVCEVTPYAKAQGTSKSGSATCWWWLRSPGDSSYSAAHVSTDGSVNYSGNYVNNDYGVVRPVVVLRLSQ